MGSGKVSTSKFLGAPINFSPSPSMRKGRDGEKKWKMEREKNAVYSVH